ncbi:MAG: hypothetical protein ACKVWR_13730 [Acidimicrobiales bacterium]
MRVATPDPARLDRLNRSVLGLLGAIALGLGAAALAAGWGAFGDDVADGPVLSADLRDWVRTNATWFWLAVAAAALLAALAGWRWLRRQLRPAEVIHRIELERSERGMTELRAVAAADALAADLESDPEVLGARVRLRSGLPDPKVMIELDAPEDSDLAALDGRVRARFVERFRQALDAEVVHAHLRFRLVASRGRRVR